MAKAKESVDEERTYQQLRARLALSGEVNDDVKANFRLATASSAISTNQTLGDSSDPGMARRSFGLDQAYIDWQFLKHGHLWAGRTPNPFWAPNKVQTIYDADLAFEGFAIKWEPKWSHTSLFLNLAGYMISENYDSSSGKDSVDIGLVGGDLGWSWKDNGYNWTIHFGNYYFLNVQNSRITRIDKDAKIDSYSYPFDRYRGNTVYVDDPLLPADQRKYFYQTEFVLMEVGTELRKKFSDFEIFGFADFLENTKVGQFGRAREYGAGVKWRWVTISESTVKKELDSVLGAFTDSDTNGGGTDNIGSRTSIAFQLGKASQLTATRYKSKRGIDSTERDFSSTHLDLSVSF